MSVRLSNVPGHTSNHVIPLDLHIEFTSVFSITVLLVLAGFDGYKNESCGPLFYPLVNPSLFIHVAVTFARCIWVASWPI